ncbi:MAG TPA: hypothetical protein VII66_02810 [Gemmatimonadaceae bacterium]
MSDTTVKIIAALWALVALALIGAKFSGASHKSWWLVTLPVTIPLLAALLYGAFLIALISTVRVE